MNEIQSVPGRFGCCISRASASRPILAPHVMFRGSPALLLSLLVALARAAFLVDQLPLYVVLTTPTELATAPSGTVLQLSGSQAIQVSMYACSHAQGEDPPCGSPLTCRSSFHGR